MTAIARKHSNQRMSQLVVHGGTAYLAGQVALETRGQSVTNQTTEILAAIGSVAGGLRPDNKIATPMPVLHVAGEKDPIVKFVWQKATFAAVRRFNGCSDEGRPWAKEGVLEATLYPSAKGAPLVTAIHAGGHEYAKGSSELIARFFKENPKSAK